MKYPRTWLGFIAACSCHNGQIFEMTETHDQNAMSMRNVEDGDTVTYYNGSFTPLTPMAKAMAAVVEARP